MYVMMKRHPSLYMSDAKEPNFMASELKARAVASDSDPREADAARRDAIELEVYRSLYADARPDQLTGDASVLNLWSSSAAANIAGLRPDAKIIALLREPVSLLRSFHLEQVQRHVETCADFREALGLEEARRRSITLGHRIDASTGTIDQSATLLYSDHARYVEQLQRYQARFEPDQMLVLIYDDYRDHNIETMRRVLRFLGVADEVSGSPVEANLTYRVRLRRANKFTYALKMGDDPRFRTAKAAIKLITPQRTRRDVLVALQRHVILSRSKPTTNRDDRDLQRLFKPEVVKLSEHLGIDLVSRWGYEKIH